MVVVMMGRRMMMNRRMMMGRSMMVMMHWGRVMVTMTMQQILPLIVNNVGLVSQHGSSPKVPMSGLLLANNAFMRLSS